MEQLIITNNATLDQAQAIRPKRPGIRVLTPEEIEQVDGAVHPAVVCGAQGAVVAGVTAGAAALLTGGALTPVVSVSLIGGFVGGVASYYVGACGVWCDISAGL